MSNLKVQTIHHLRGSTGTVNYITTTNNAEKDFQIGVGDTTTSYTKALEINNLGVITIPMTLECPAINGSAVSATKDAYNNEEIHQFYTNSAELVVAFKEIKDELIAEEDPDPPSN